MHQVLIILLCFNTPPVPSFQPSFPLFRVITPPMFDKQSGRTFMGRVHIKFCVPSLHLRLSTLDTGQKGKFTKSVEGEMLKKTSSDHAWPQLLCLVVIFLNLLTKSSKSVVYTKRSGLVRFALFVSSQTSQRKSKSSSQRLHLCFVSVSAHQAKCAKCEVTISDEFWGAEGAEGAGRGSPVQEEVKLGHVAHVD